MLHAIRVTAKQPNFAVMEILGHSNISLTLNTYSHVMPEMLRDAANAMNPVMSQPNLANS
jgi:integrase